MTPETTTKWRYVETEHGAEAHIGGDNNVILRPYWKGGIAPAELRTIVRMAAAAPDLYTFLQKIYLDYEDDCGCECSTETCCAVVGEPCAKCHARIALALVTGTTEEGDEDE